MDDQFYDSLEQESLSDDESLNSGDDAFKNQSDNIQYELSEFIPYYSGEVIKKYVRTSNNVRRKCSKIPVLKHKSLQSKSNNKRSETNLKSINNEKKKPAIRNKSKESTVKPKEDNSYLKLFYSRIGCSRIHVDKKLSDTTRAIDGDSSYRTASNGSLDMGSDTQTPRSVSDSERKFYLGYIAKDEVVPPLKLKTRNSSVHIRSTPSTLAEDFPCRASRSLSKCSSIHGRKANFTLPMLGGLGPDVYGAKDKLRRFMKRKEYGQTASNKNRLKILEEKLLNDLEIVTSRVQEL